MRYNLIFILMLFCQMAAAQLSVTPSALQFGTVSTGDQKNATIRLQNTSNEVIEITEIQFYDSAFSLEFTPFSLSPGALKELEIIFHPKQNIRYNSELILLIDKAPKTYRVDLRGESQLNLSYYSGTFDLYDEDLKAELKRTISANYKQLGYTAARDAMYATLDNESGWVTCVYTGRKAQFSTRAGANSNQFNTEHTWPQSLFSQREPERSDIHHLFPTDASANTRRSNLPFGVVPQPTWTEGGSKWQSGTFEPRDEQKGATARAMFYFAIRYSNYSNFLDNQEAILREWHHSFQPSEQESNRNQAIYQLQNNRNPFVDFPGFVNRIQSISNFRPEEKKAAISLSTEQIQLQADNRTYRVYLINYGRKAADIEWSKSQAGNVEVLTPSPFSVNPGEAVAVELRVPVGSPPEETEIVFSYGEEKTLRINTNSAGLSAPLPTTNQFIWDAQNATLKWNDAQHKVNEPMIYDMSGKKWPLTEYKAGLNEWNLSSLPLGIYFVCDRKNNEQRCFRIFKH